MSPRKSKFLTQAPRILLLAAFLGLLVWASLAWGPGLTRLVRHPEKFKELVDRAGPLSALLYIGLQAAQIVIAVIPGEIVQIAGGYAFGTFLGTVYAVLGTLLGTILVFLAVRLFGYGLVKAFVPAAKLEKFRFLLDDPKSEVALFLLFLIPGLPKDTLTYLAGLTPVRPAKFILICLAARFPSLWGSAYIGANIQEKNYLAVWIVSGAALLLFLAGVLLRDRILAFLHHLRRGNGRA